MWGHPDSTSTQTALCNVRHRRAGFSLVELLVVIGVVVVLIGLVMPTIEGSRAEAKRRICQSEMRQLAMMITAYCG